MLILSGGLALLIRTDGDNGIVLPPADRIRVAVLDSGIDIDYSMEGRIAEQQSFVLTQYGYSANDLSVTDSNPESIPHGTVVAKTVLASSQNTVVVNGKVLGSEGIATPIGLIAAIHWAVEQNCSIINLSLGSSPTWGDPLKIAVEWAFDHGVVVVAAGGNENVDDLPGTSITSPSVFSKCLSVAAVDATGAPMDFSSHGPTADVYMKPDISALGYTDTADGRYLGTSFAAPKVAAAAADLIAYCIQNNITYTPGSIYTALLMGVTRLPHPEYVVGAGLLNKQSAISELAANSEEGELPKIAYAHPSTLPIEYERLFYGDVYQFNLQIFTSSLTTFDVEISSNNTTMFSIDSEVTINQTGFVPLTIYVPSSGGPSFSGAITFQADGFAEASLSISFTASTALARIAFDTSFTSWSIDTHYGQFRDFYRLLTDNGISVSEIRSESEISLDYLESFDGVILLDPFVWDLNETDPEHLSLFSLPYSNESKQAYSDYYFGGGGVFVTTLSNFSSNVGRLNDFIDWSGFSFDSPRISVSDSPVLVTNIYPHLVTNEIVGFDFLGARIFLPAGATELARYGGNFVLGCLQDASGGRIVVTGTNYFIDNWGINEQYAASDDAQLALQIVQWITNLI